MSNGLRAHYAGRVAHIHWHTQLDEVVATRTQVNCLVANPFAGMSVSDRVRPRNLVNDASSLMVACGLALRRFEE
ncbi:hypothetical protein AZSP09_28520 [Azospira sp. I09]|nr:hypothetical protein AZSP09_28520 [Azospira sp. I09]